MKALFWICVAIGLCLRLFALFTKPLWFDESITYFFAKLPVKSVLEAVASDNNPPLYYLLIHFLQGFSQSEYMLRIPSLIASIAVIFATIKLSRILNLKDPYFAASLLSLSSLAIYLSWEARLHSLASLFAVLLTISYFNLQKNHSPKNFLIFVILATISFYTQYYLILVLIPFTFITIFKFKNNLRVWIQTALAPILLLVPWLLYSQKFIHNLCWCPNTLISLPASLVAPIISGVGQITQRTFTTLPLPILVLFALSSLLFTYFLAKGITKDFKVSSLYLLPLLAIAIPGFFVPIFSPKGFSIFAPFFFLVISNSNPKMTQKVLMLALLLAISTIQFTHPHFQEDNLKDLYADISQYNVPIFHTSIITLYPMEFYAKSSNNNFLISKNPLSEQTTMLIGGTKQAPDPKSEQFLLVHSKTFTPQEVANQLFQNLEKNYTQTLVMEYKNLAVYQENKR